MAEIGLIASVIQVAGAGLKLSQTLYQYADSVASADRRIKDIAKEVQLTSFVIDELGHIFKQDQSSAVLSRNAIKTADETVKECSNVFLEMDAALKKSGKRGMSKILWPFREPKMELLRKNIERLKSTLMLLMHVLTHAHQVASQKRDHEAEAAQREQIKTLIRRKKESTKRYEESLRNYSMSEDGSTVINDEDDPNNDNLSRAPTKVELSVMTSSISSTLTPESLQTCVQHIQSLLESLENLQKVIDDSDAEEQDTSEHHQSIIGSYFRAREHLDTVILGSSKGRSETRTKLFPIGSDDLRKSEASLTRTEESRTVDAETERIATNDKIKETVSQETRTQQTVTKTIIRDRDIGTERSGADEKTRLEDVLEKAIDIGQATEPSDGFSCGKLAAGKTFDFDQSSFYQQTSTASGANPFEQFEPKFKGSPFIESEQAEMSKPLSGRPSTTKSTVTFGSASPFKPGTAFGKPTPSVVEGGSFGPSSESSGVSLFAQKPVAGGVLFGPAGKPAEVAKTLLEQASAEAKNLSVQSAKPTEVVKPLFGQATQPNGTNSLSEPSVLSQHPQLPGSDQLSFFGQSTGYAQLSGFGQQYPQSVIHNSPVSHSHQLPPYLQQRSASSSGQPSVQSQHPTTNPFGVMPTSNINPFSLQFQSPKLNPLASPFSFAPATASEVHQHYNTNAAIPEPTPPNPPIEAETTFGGENHRLARVEREESKIGAEFKARVKKTATEATRFPAQQQLPITIMDAVGVKFETEEEVKVEEAREDEPEAKPAIVPPPKPRSARNKKIVAHHGMVNPPPPPHSPGPGAIVVCGPPLPHPPPSLASVVVEMHASRNDEGDGSEGLSKHRRTSRHRYLDDEAEVDIEDNNLNVSGLYMEKEEWHGLESASDAHEWPSGREEISKAEFQRRKNKDAVIVHASSDDILASEDYTVPVIEAESISLARKGHDRPGVEERDALGSPPEPNSYGWVQYQTNQPFKLLVSVGDKNSRRRMRGRKSALTPEARNNAALMRVIGACSNCKRRKEKCDPGIPCKACVEHYRDDLINNPCRRNAASAADRKTIESEKGSQTQENLKTQWESDSRGCNALLESKNNDTPLPMVSLGREKRPYSSSPGRGKPFGGNDESKDSSTPQSLPIGRKTGPYSSPPGRAPTPPKEAERVTGLAPNSKNEFEEAETEAEETKNEDALLPGQTVEFTIEERPNSQPTTPMAYSFPAALWMQPVSDGAENPDAPPREVQTVTDLALSLGAGASKSAVPDEYVESSDGSEGFIPDYMMRYYAGAPAFQASGDHYVDSSLRPIQDLDSDSGYTDDAVEKRIRSDVDRMDYTMRGPPLFSSMSTPQPPAPLPRPYHRPSTTHRAVFNEVYSSKSSGAVKGMRIVPKERGKEDETKKEDAGEEEYDEVDKLLREWTTVLG